MGAQKENQKHFMSTGSVMNSFQHQETQQSKETFCLPRNWPAITNDSTSIQNCFTSSPAIDHKTSSHISSTIRIHMYITISVFAFNKYRGRMQKNRIVDIKTIHDFRML